MKRISMLGLVAAAMFAVPLFLMAAPVAALPTQTSFHADGPNYVAEATGRGATESEAQNDALRTAIGVIMESLGKDRLFTELFRKNPPVTMSWKNLSSRQEGAAWSVKVRLVVDDESLRLLYNTGYVSTVSTMLDEAEKRLADAERLESDARKEELLARLGAAMSLYWQTRDACDAGLDLLAPIGDAAVFSTSGKKKAPELREILTTIRATADSGYDRVSTAERGLASDQSQASALAAIASLETQIAETEDWSKGLADEAATVESTSRAELQAQSDELAARHRSMSDARLALARVEQVVPRANQTTHARIDIQRRRIDTVLAYMRKTKSLIDQELRDPAIARTKRTQNIRWMLLHQPTGALSVRLYSPFGLDPESRDIAFIDTGRFEFGLRSEGAFGGDQGLWISTAFKKDDAVLATPSGGQIVKNSGYTQSIDLGYYRHGLLGAGLTWDWLRRVDGQSVDKRLSLHAFVGGMDQSNSYATWLGTLSWEVPYELSSFEAANVFNFSLISIVRLGRVVELDTSLSLRPRQNASYGYDGVLRYSAGAGFHLPGPFLWGLEFAGSTASSFYGSYDQTASYIRMFAEYSL
jgi:hypothetical protein